MIISCGVCRGCSTVNSAVCFYLGIGLPFPHEVGADDLSRSLLAELLHETQNNPLRINRKRNPASVGKKWDKPPVQ